jgi:helicase required for RNAi-mediated heterochromatin assembly 1
VYPADFVPILQEHITRQYQLRNEHAQEPWQQLPEIPSGREMNSDSSNGASHNEANLPENIVNGPWGSKEAYIGTQYQLLRHDAMYPLQDSIRSYKANPGTADLPTTSIYTHVRYLKLFQNLLRLTMNRFLLWDIRLPTWAQQLV